MSTPRSNNEASTPSNGTTFRPFFTYTSLYPRPNPQLPLHPNHPLHYLPVVEIIADEVGVSGHREFVSLVLCRKQERLHALCKFFATLHGIFKIPIRHLIFQFVHRYVHACSVFERLLVCIITHGTVAG